MQETAGVNYELQFDDNNLHASLYHTNAFVCNTITN